MANNDLERLAKPFTCNRGHTGKPYRGARGYPICSTCARERQKAYSARRRNAKQEAKRVVGV